MAVLEAPQVYKSHHVTSVPDMSEMQEAVKEDFSKIMNLKLPAEDGIPMESNWHRLAMNLLIESVHSHWRDRTDYFAGGNMFVYYSLEQIQNLHDMKKTTYRGPDVFVVKDVDGTYDRDSWVAWEEEGRYPDVIVELASPTTISADMTTKKHLYEQTFHTLEYFCYDPRSEQLRGWRLVEGVYQEIQPNNKNWLWSRQLQTWLGTWKGEFLRINAVWLRLYGQDETIVPTLEESQAQRAEAEAQRAEKAENEVERLRALLKQHGIPHGETAGEAWKATQ